MKMSVLVGFRRNGAFELLLASLLFCGCEKVVSIDLNNADPHLVIEGIVTDQPGPYTVTLSKTGTYFVDELFFPPVTNALIVVTDDQGQKDTLKEITSGTYQSSSLKGIVGRTYALDVVAEGRPYSATSSMPKKVYIDSLYARVRQESRGQPGYDITITFKDPPEPGNYYRINARSSAAIPADSIDGRRYRVYTDKLTNGNEMEERIRAGRNVAVGDTITVELLSIDRATYDYFNTLRDVLSSDRSPTSLSPTNPMTNLNNGSLGYFSAWTIDVKTIILK
jgi:hypothetical protein